MFRQCANARCVFAIAFVCAIAFPPFVTRLIAQPTIVPGGSAPPPNKELLKPAVSPDLLKPETGDDELRKLLKERYNAASREVQILLARREIEVNKLANTRATFAARRRRGEVALEIFDKPEDQIRILTELLSEATSLEKEVQSQLRAGGVGSPDSALGPVDYERALGQRLDIEILLVKAKQKRKPVK